MSSNIPYSASTVFVEMKKRFHQYLEAQYHIWNEDLIAGREALLKTEGVTFQSPRLEATAQYAPGTPYASLTIPESAKRLLQAAAEDPSTGIPKLPYRHQAEALESFLNPVASKEIVVATGTGSGKTECFLMPILGSLAIESSTRQHSWRMPGCRALLLYPMNALVNDQLTRLRRILDHPEVAQQLRSNRDARASFGMYTSRTQYPGLRTAAKDKSRLKELIQSKYLALPAIASTRLKREGQWPAKDLERYIQNACSTGPEDSEMFSRQEMQTKCPDILVTNYSMLEYMLLRPIERSLFEQTRLWLEADTNNTFTVVLDEAHMYRGAGGAEVAYLLRRLHARLGVPRDRIKYILTSASLGETPEADRRMQRFAADISGSANRVSHFIIIRGEKQKKMGERPATLAETAALANFDYSAMYRRDLSGKAAVAAFNTLSAALKSKTIREGCEQEELQDAIFSWIESFGPAALLTNLLASRPQQLKAISKITFPGTADAGLATEALIALMSFARERVSGRVYAPVRSHLFFRGIAGLYACIDLACNQRSHSESALLGKLYSSPKVRCDCGARVYEVLTHRDCGTAFIRAYMNDQFGDFLWHEPSTGLWTTGGLLETHFLVEVDRRSSAPFGRLEGTRNWLHKTTGRLLTSPPSSNESEYLPILRPNGLVPIGGHSIYSFANECPVCVRSWQNGTTKIMDLATKGEAPFAQLIRTQVELQPATIEVTPQSSNGGRKSLLFSDGRQKAARLARDIPREIESDVFRQILALAAKELENLSREPSFGTSMYVALLHVMSKHSLLLFDGNDRQMLQRDIENHRQYYQDDLRDALEDPPSSVPSRLSALLLKQLGSPYYSVSALTLASLVPTRRAEKALRTAVPVLSELDLRNILAIWIQGFASKYAIDPNLTPGIRIQAAGYPVTVGLDAHGGLSVRQQNFLRERWNNVAQTYSAFSSVLCQPKPNTAGVFLDPSKIVLKLASDAERWCQCEQCATISPVDWWGHCPNCLSTNIQSVQPGTTSYLRARKSFFRDPVNEVLEGRAIPFNLSVEEHTAQLSHRDLNEASPTTEQYERRFKDILVDAKDVSIDVLSCTTTMEVGIDIGSLIGVGLRNVPPMRQNYQQRAGRAGRRGSALSTVLTYAQNGPHDSFYFMNPDPIISGEPTLPGIDIENPKIIERHIRAQLVQRFFHGQNPTSGLGDIYSVLGSTLDFYNGAGPFSLIAFRQWIFESSAARECCDEMRNWLPPSFSASPSAVAFAFVNRLQELAPTDPALLDASEEHLIEFLFSRGFLPAYAFPRDLCALQIEEDQPRGQFPPFKTVQRPQQGLNIALSEYAPGRFVVVDKKTYRIGTVAAGGTSAVVNRAERLFANRKFYVHCPACEYTLGFSKQPVINQTCPLCRSSLMVSNATIEPEVVFPDGGHAIDEYDDEQTFTTVTTAQLSVAEGSSTFHFRSFGSNGNLAFARNQHLAMVNKGEEDSQYMGFFVCNLCGKTGDRNVPQGPHIRDYKISPRPQGRCDGEFEDVYLGYGFSSDVLLLRIPLKAQFRFDPVLKTEREPISDALLSLAEAVVISIGRTLEIDVREINSGFRFGLQAEDRYADLFFYDTLSGGAGYATQAGEQFEAVMQCARNLLSDCTCGSSCTECLRHFGNRFHHNKLDRFLALDLLTYVLDGKLPAPFSLDSQRTILTPLIDMLTLAGWAETRKSKDGFGFKRGDSDVTISTFPSLIQPRHYGFTNQDTHFAISPFEVSRDLPGALGLFP